MDPKIMSKLPHLAVSRHHIHLPGGPTQHVMLQPDDRVAVGLAEREFLNLDPPTAGVDLFQRSALQPRLSGIRRGPRTRGLTPELINNIK